jgi:MFS family permease
MVTEPLLQDLRLTDPDGRVFFASLNFWGTLIGAFFCLPVGWLFDRLDRRWILAGNLILLGLVVLWMSRIETWQSLFVAIIFTRGLGQSALSVVSITLVAKSFPSERLGIAMAWYSILSMPFHVLLIRTVGWALTDAQWGWRAVWATVGVSLMILSAGALVLARKPSMEPALRVESRAGVSLGEALRTPAFWVFSLTISIWGLIYSGVALFNVDIFRERGFDERLYFNVLTMVAIVALGSKMFFGWLVNHVRLTRLLSVCLLITALSLLGLPLATRTWHAYAYGFGLGIASGAVALLFFATWGRLYGQRELGRIQGFAQMLTVFSSAAGPLLLSQGKRLTDSYTSVFQLMAVAVLAMGIAAWFTPLPRFSNFSSDPIP